MYDRALVPVVTIIIWGHLNNSKNMRLVRILGHRENLVGWIRSRFVPISSQLEDIGLWFGFLGEGLISPRNYVQLGQCEGVEAGDKNLPDRTSTYQATDLVPPSGKI